MSKRIILHIGWPKTGSSSLQIFFAQNINQLREVGIVYPEVFNLAKSKEGVYGQGNGYSLAYSLLENKSQTFCSLPTYSLYDFEKTLLNIDVKYNVLFSTEWFTALSEDALMMIRDIGLRNGFSFTIVGYVRPYISFLNSEYAQGVKIGKILSRADCWDWNHSYQSIADTFLRVFGHESIFLRPFIKECWVNRSLHNDFLYSVGVLNNYDIFHEGNENNQSLMPHVLNIQLGMNVLGISFSQNQLMLIDRTFREFFDGDIWDIKSKFWFNSISIRRIIRKLRYEAEYMTDRYFSTDEFLLKEFDSFANYNESFSLNDACLDITGERNLFERSLSNLIDNGKCVSEKGCFDFIYKANRRLASLLADI